MGHSRKAAQHGPKGHECNRFQETPKVPAWARSDAVMEDRAWVVTDAVTEDTKQSEKASGRASSEASPRLCGAVRAARWQDVQFCLETRPLRIPEQ